MSGSKDVSGFAGVTDTALMEIIVSATLARAKQKAITLSTAAENVLTSAVKDFCIPAERLPPHDLLVWTVQGMVP